MNPIRASETGLGTVVVLSAAMTGCFEVWLLGEMWVAAARGSGSATEIGSPARFLWAAQLALMALHLRAGVSRMAPVCAVVLAAPLPLWTLLGLTELAALTVLIRAHLATALAALALVVLAAALSRLPTGLMRSGAVVCVQVLCATALFGSSYQVWKWVSG